MTANVLHETILEPITEEHPRNSEAAVAVLQDGRLLLVWSDFYGGPSDFSEAQVSGRISDDVGRTWGERLTVVANAGQMCTYSPSLIRLQSGSLGITYFVKNSEGDNRVYWRKSSDEGQTWSEPAAVTPEPAYYIINNDRAVQLSSGRLLAPISYVPHYYPTASFRSRCWYSDDEGVTWQRGTSEITLPKRGAMEPGVIERKDGSLLMWVRTQLGSQYRAVSYDMGDTWTDVRPLGLVSSEAPACIKRIPQTGDLVMIWNHVFDPFRSHWGRTPLTSAISRDDGETWEKVRDLEREHDHFYAYTSITFHEDEVLLTYYRSKVGIQGTELKLKILPLDWFYD